MRQNAALYGNVLRHGEKMFMLRYVRKIFMLRYVRKIFMLRYVRKIFMLRYVRKIFMLMQKCIFLCHALREILWGKIDLF